MTDFVVKTNFNETHICRTKDTSAIVESNMYVEGIYEGLTLAGKNLVSHRKHIQDHYYLITEVIDKDTGEIYVTVDEAPESEED